MSDYVFVVISEHWEDWEIHGVHRTLNGAFTAHPVSQPMEWRNNGEGGLYLDGTKRGEAWFIQRHEVKE